MDGPHFDLPHLKNEPSAYSRLRVLRLVAGVLAMPVSMLGFWGYGYLCEHYPQHRETIDQVVTCLVVGTIVLSLSTAVVLHRRQQRR
jgi:hypothetical protein